MEYYNRIFEENKKAFYEDIPKWSAKVAKAIVPYMGNR